jgi:hypothetical protein
MTVVAGAFLGLAKKQRKYVLRFIPQAFHCAQTLALECSILLAVGVFFARYLPFGLPITPVAEMTFDKPVSAALHFFLSSINHV